MRNQILIILNDSSIILEIQPFRILWTEVLKKANSVQRGNLDLSQKP